MRKIEKDFNWQIWNSGPPLKCAVRDSMAWHGMAWYYYGHALICGFHLFAFSSKGLDGTALQFHVRCATEFKTCYVIWRSPATGVLGLCHPDTIKVMQSSNAPKSGMYRFAKPFFGKREKNIVALMLFNPWWFSNVHGATSFCLRAFELFWGGRGTSVNFGYLCATKVFKPWLYLGMKKEKTDSFFRALIQTMTPYSRDLWEYPGGGHTSWKSRVFLVKRKNLHCVYYLLSKHFLPRYPTLFCQKIAVYFLNTSTLSKAHSSVFHLSNRWHFWRFLNNISVWNYMYLGYC